MGANESTASPSNRTEEERRRRLRQVFETGAAVAAGAAVAFGAYRMVSGQTETEGNQEAMIHRQPESVTDERRHFDTLNLESRQTGIRWSPPRLGWLKMNTDGGCRPIRSVEGIAQGPSGCGGILRDHRGRCVGGFAEYIGFSDCLTSEIKGILNGLRFLDERIDCFEENMILESDCDQAVDWINGVNSVNRTNSKIIRACSEDIEKCKQLIEKNRNRIEVQGCDRDANKCADKLAEIARTQELDYQEFGKGVPSEVIREIIDRESPITI